MAPLVPLVFPHHILMSSVIYYQTYTWQHEAFLLNIIKDLGTTPFCKLWEKVKTVAVITRYCAHRSCRSLKRVGMFFFYHDFSPEEKKLTFVKGKLKHIYVTVQPTPKAKRIIFQPKYSAGKFLTWAKRRTLTSIEQNWNTRSEVLTSPSKIEIPV